MKQLYGTKDYVLLSVPDIDLTSFFIKAELEKKFRNGDIYLTPKGKKIYIECTDTMDQVSNIKKLSSIAALISNLWEEFSS